MTIQSVLEFADNQRADNLNALIEFLRIPSISTLPQHQPDIERAANWLAGRMRSIGLDRVQLIPTAGHPVVYGEWVEAGPQAPTMLVYGHYDVQPVDPEDEWVSPPFEPTVRDGNLYARGASDNKGQVFAQLAAAEAFLRAEGALPVNLKFLVEGQEESGGDLAPIIEQHSALLACDAVVISDDSFMDAHTPKIGTGVRGCAYMEVEIQGPRHDLHSGGYGGVVHNPLQVAVEMLAALHDEQGRVAIPGFYDSVLPLPEDEREAWGRIPFDQKKFRQEEVGAPALWSGEQGYSIRERIGARPTLDIHGIQGGFTDDGQKTIIPANVVIKVSMRLVPDQDPGQIARLFEQRIHQLAPPTVQIQVRTLSGAYPAVVDHSAPAIQAAVAAYRQGFSKEPVFVRGGGSLPVVANFIRLLRVPVVMMGFGLPDDNLHSPNEKLNLDHFYGGINTSIHFIDNMADRSATPRIERG